MVNIHARYERANKTSRIIPHGAMTVLWGKTKELQNCRINDFTGKVIGSQPKGSSNAFLSGRGVDATGGAATVGRNSAVKHGALTGDAL